MSNDMLNLQFVPIAEATFALKATREVIIRRINRGLLEGRYENGRWYVARHELESAAKRNTLTSRSA